MRLIKHILSGLMFFSVVSTFAGIALQPANRQCTKCDDFVSKNMFSDTSKMECFYFSSDDIYDPAEREAMRVAMRSNFSLGSIINAPLKEDEKLFTVKCVFAGQDMPYFAIYNTDFFLESKMNIWFESKEADTYYFKVPAGTYDINTQYYSNVEGMKGIANLVRENVIVNDDVEINFNPEELTEKVVIQPILRDGSEAILPLRVESGLDYTDATISYSNYMYVFFREGCNVVMDGCITANMLIPALNGETVFLSNKLSDKYHFIFQYYLEDLNGEIQITTTDVAGIKNGIINNYTKDFEKFPVPTFSKTPLYNEIGIEENHLFIESLWWLNDVQIGHGGVYTRNINPEVYYTMQTIGNYINIKSPIRVTSLQAEKKIKYQEEEDGEIYEWYDIKLAEMIGLPTIKKDDKWLYINQNHSECGNYAYQCPEEGPIVEYPGVPSYCYFADEITQLIGNSSPVLSLMTQVNEYPNATIFLFEPQAYIGRYGEVRNCDKWTLHSVVNLNGETVFDSESGKYWYEWCNENSTNGHEKGLIEATFTNRNVLVDETIPGFNITTIKVDERNSDLCTPTTQMLIFKNTNGIITDRFSGAEEGIIEFSAGDFNWNWVNGGEKHYYSCEEADVKVEYAPYGEESFMPLEVEEIPENYYMPGFGYFYRGSLADVTMPSSNGWYDVRFTLTDKAGNEMVQHISPAFKIDANTSVAEIAVDGIKVWSVDGKILTAGSDIESIALYSADGKLIASANGSFLPTNGYRGMGIVKVTSTTGTTTTHKTVIR